MKALFCSKEIPLEDKCRILKVQEGMRKTQKAVLYEVSERQNERASLACVFFSSNLLFWEEESSCEAAGTSKSEAGKKKRIC